MVTISQCMIVKNEEKNIRKALSWGKRLVCEQIVVDTGSTDRTVEIAEEMGAKVYHFTWIDDFSAAKNYAIEQASGDWIAFLDADEYFAEKDIKKLKNIVKIINEKVVYVNGNKERTNALLCALVNLNREGKPFSAEIQTRLFRNDKNIRYIGKIHEQIVGLNGNKIIQADASDDLTIFHTGYGLEREQDIAGKAERNIRLIKEQLELYPDNPDWNLYMAETMAFIGNRKETIAYANKALERKEELTIKNGIVRVYWNLLLQLLEDEENKEKSLLEMERLYKEAVEANRNYPDFDIFLAFAYLRKANDWEHAVYHLEESLKKLENKKNRVNGSRGFFYIKEIYYYLVLGYLKRGDASRCVQNAVIFLKIDKYHEEVLRILLYLLKEDGCDNNGIYHILNQIYQLKNEKDKLFVQKAAQLEGIANLLMIKK